MIRSPNTILLLLSNSMGERGITALINNGNLIFFYIKKRTISRLVISLIAITLSACRQAVLNFFV